MTSKSIPQSKVSGTKWKNHWSGWSLRHLFWRGERWIEEKPEGQRLNEFYKIAQHVKGRAGSQNLQASSITVPGTELKALEPKMNSTGAPEDPWEKGLGVSILTNVWNRPLLIFLNPVASPIRLSSLAPDVSEFMTLGPVGEAEYIRIVTSNTQNGIASTTYTNRIVGRMVNFAGG